MPLNSRLRHGKKMNSRLRHRKKRKKKEEIRGAHFITRAPKGLARVVILWPHE